MRFEARIYTVRHIGAPTPTLRVWEGWKNWYSIDPTTPLIRKLMHVSIGPSQRISDVD
jgi:hypothetical protein